MKANNKGYSLVELVMTLGCFSIIMLAIMLMMRTTIATYKDGLIETKKQQEAQIVANQVADMIIDATAYSDGVTVKDVNGTVLSSDYGFTADGQPVRIVFNSSSKTLNLSYSGVPTPLSDNVKEFEIQGLRTAKQDEDADVDAATIKTIEYDNTCRVRIKIDYMGREYEAVKDVHFRNNIENPKQYNVDEDDAATPSPTPSGEKEICVLRYETIDLTKKYGITEIVSQQNMAGWYDVDATTVNRASHGITVKCNSVINGNFNAPNNKTSNCKITGKDKDGHQTTFWFYTEPFSFDVGTKPIFMDHYDIETNNGYHQDVPVKGVHINEMLKAGKSIKYTVAFKSGGTALATSGEQSLSASSGSNGLASVTLSIGGKDLQVGLIPNAFDNDFMITTGNPKNKGQVGDTYHTSDGKQELEFSITFDGETSPRVLTYKYYMAGETLEHAAD